MKKLFLIMSLMLSFSTFAADIPALKKLFLDNYSNFYVPRNCGGNVGRLIEAAERENINLQGAYALNITGAGFLETSGFFTRSGKINDRAMLGYFHVVMVADGYVFDFDLAKPLVLPIEDYVRLQLTPPTIPFKIGSIQYDPRNEFPWWTVERFEWKRYITEAQPKATWKKKMTEFINLESVLKKKRLY